MMTTMTSRHYRVQDSNQAQRKLKTLIKNKELLSGNVIEY